MAGTSAEPLRAAIRLADSSVWRTIRAVAEREEVEGAIIADLGAGLSAYLKYLETRVEVGYDRGSASLLTAGGRLLQALVQHRVGAVVQELADAAGRHLAEQVVMLVAQRHRSSPAGMTLPAQSLAAVDGDRTIVVVAVDRVAAARTALLGLGPQVVVAESWPVALGHVGHAFRWTYRALALAENGQLRPEDRAVDCARHRTALLLGADPALIGSLEEEMLSPLYAEKPSYRLDLAETLVLLLETDEPASALSKRLGTCPQTVRNRRHRLEEMFGEQLADPQRRLALIIVLNAVLPRWRAERAPGRRIVTRVPRSRS